MNTPVGMPESANVGEVIGQGSAGGALASQANIDHGLNSYFEGSGDEVSYGSVRLQPMSFQDEIARIVSDVGSAQAGNVKISSMMKEKQLEVHPDKTGFIVLGAEKYRKQI